MRYTFVRNVEDNEKLEYDHHYVYNVNIWSVFGNGFAGLSSEEYISFIESLKSKLYDKGLVVVDVNRIGDYEVELVSRCITQSPTALAIIVVIGVALAVFGLWIVRHNIKEVAVAGATGFSFGILLLIGIFFFGLFKKGKS